MPLTLLIFSLLCLGIPFPIVRSVRTGNRALSWSVLGLLLKDVNRTEPPDMLTQEEVKALEADAEEKTKTIPQANQDKQNVRYRREGERISESDKAPSMRKQGALAGDADASDVLSE